MDTRKLLLKKKIKNNKKNLNQTKTNPNPNQTQTPEKSIHIINNYQQPINQMKGYVINLKKRPDRLERFNSNITNKLPFISFEVIEAIDGNTLDLKDNLLIKRINEWTLKRLHPKLFRGVVGCCISHLECINRIANGEDNYAIVFEDDCVFKDNLKKEFFK